LDSIFSTVAANWFQIKSKSVTEDYAKDIWRSLDKDVFPTIGAIPVQEIKPERLLKHWSQSKLVVHLRLFVVWYSVLTR
jgi:hypothetical protein